MRNTKTHRVGEIEFNKQGLAMQIIEYVNNKKILIEFPATGQRVWTRYDTFKRGYVKADVIKYPFKGIRELKVLFAIAGIGLVAVVATALYLILN